MADIDIKKFLRKRKYTGADVGKVLLYSMMNDIKNRGNKDYEILISGEEFDKVLSKMDSEQEYDIYKVYETLYFSIVESYNRCVDISNKFNYGISSLSYILDYAILEDNKRQVLSGYPLMITEEKYTSLLKMAKNFKMEHKESFFRLLASVLKLAIDDFTKSGNIFSNEVKHALFLAKQERVENENAIRDYMRCQRVSPTADTSKSGFEHNFSEIISKKCGIEDDATENIRILDGIAYTFTNSEHCPIKNGDKLFFEGENAVKDYFCKLVGKELNIDAKKLYELFGKAINSNETDSVDAFAEIINITSMNSEITTKNQSISKYSILESGYYAKAGKELQTDCPLLYKELCDYIAKNISSSLGENDTITWGELAKLGIEPYVSMVEVTDKDIADVMPCTTAAECIKRDRVLHYGVAILKTTDSSLVDANGYFIEDTKKQFKNKIIDDISKIENDRINYYMNMIGDRALSYMYGYNEILGILERVYDVDGLSSDARFNLEQYEMACLGYNEKVYSFYRGVYGNDTIKEDRREKIKSLFKPIDYNEYKPKSEIIETVYNRIKYLGSSDKSRVYLRNLDSVINDLHKGVI